jgi:hypothetical protein
VGTSKSLKKFGSETEHIIFGLSFCREKIEFIYRIVVGMLHLSEPWFYDVEDLGPPLDQQFWAWTPSDHVLNIKKLSQRAITKRPRTIKTSEF